MTPYYSEVGGGVTIYHGDVLEVLPTLDMFDLIFTSPPYNLGVSPGGGMGPGSIQGFGHYRRDARLGDRGGGDKWGGGNLTKGYDDFDDAMPMDKYEAWQREVLTQLWEHTAGAIFYNHKCRPWLGELWSPLCLNPGLPLRQILIWQRAGGINYSPTHYVPTCEWIMIFARREWRLRDKAASGVGDVWYVPQEANTEHPAPFPVGLPARAIETTAPKSVLDPFMGSGSTLRAAKDAGVPVVGIDRSERYCEIAVKRLAQGVLGL